MSIRARQVALLLAAAALLAAGLATGYWWAGRKSGGDADKGMPSAASGDRRVLYWFDPMVPDRHFEKPGKSPFMDMQLVPRYADEPMADAQAAPAGVVVPPGTQQNLGMRLASVQTITRRSQFEAAGTLDWSQRDVAIVQARAAGFVRSAQPLAPGDRIAAGDAIAELVLPEWTAAEQEWLLLRTRGDAQLLAAAGQCLALLGIEPAEIRRLEQQGSASDSFTVHAPRAGVLQAVDVRQGMGVMPGQALVRIHGTAVVWLEIAVPEALAAQVRAGDEVEAHAIAMPGASLRGRVAAVLPALDVASRTFTVRVELANAAGRLRPGQSVQATLRSGTGGEALAVPTEAVIRTGRRALVMLAGNGSFRPVEVVLGAEVGDQTIVAAGLAAGQQVVASGQFLLDSEASLRGLGAAAGEGQP